LMERVENGETIGVENDNGERAVMVPAYYWLGWGIKGSREIYAYDYVKKLTLS